MKKLCGLKLKIKSNKKALAYMSVIGGFLVHFSLGSIYTYGNMAPYIIKYMNATTSKGNINPGNTMWIFGLAVFGLGASMSLGSFIEEKLGTIPTVLMGCWIMSIGVIITSWTIRINLASIAISYGLVAGLGTGIAYGVSLSVPNQWFPESKGFVSGIIVAGFGLGSMIFDFLQSYFIKQNPMNFIGPVPSSFILMGSIYAVMQLIGSVIIIRPEDSTQTNDLQPEGPLTGIFDDDLTLIDEVNIKPHKLIYELDFWILWITYALNTVVAVLVISLHKVYGETLSINDDNLVIASAFGGLCNGIGRIVWGYFNDKIQYKILMWILTFSMSLMLGTFYIVTVSVDGYGLYFFWVIILHLLLSGSFSLFPAICVKTFGSKHFVGNYGMLFTAYSFGGILSNSLTTTLHKDNQSSIIFLTPFLIGSGFSFLSGLINCFYRGRSLLYKNLNL